MEVEAVQLAPAQHSSKTFKCSKWQPSDNLVVSEGATDPNFARLKAHKSNKVGFHLAGPTFQHMIVIRTTAK